MSRAAIRRLAHDAGVRLARDTYTEVQNVLIDFLKETLTAAEAAIRFSRRKSMDLPHIRYAVGVMGLELPDELVSISNADLTKLERCDLRAPPEKRKTSALTAEISEASFSRLVRSLTPMRVSARARRLLHLMAEHHMVKVLAHARTEGHRTIRADMNLGGRETSSLSSGSTREEAGILDAMEAVLKGRGIENPSEGARFLTAAFLMVVRQIPSLLLLGSTRTVDDRVIQTAVSTSVPYCDEIKSMVSPRRTHLSRVVERILRGRVADKRVTLSAIAYLTATLECLARRIVIGGSPLPRQVFPSLLDEEEVPVSLCDSAPC